MENQPTTFTVQWIREETTQMRLFSLNGENIWSFIPGQIAILAIEEIGESYFALASAPEDKDGMEFLIRKGSGVSEALYEVKKGDTVQGKGPLGRGFPIDLYHGRDLILAAVGSAIAPLRSVLRSICYRRTDFGKIALVYGARYPQDFPFLDEMEEWRQSHIEIILTASRAEAGKWAGKTGHIQSHFREAVQELHQPVAMICGMQQMIEQSREELTHLGIEQDEILTNF